MNAQAPLSHAQQLLAALAADAGDSAFRAGFLNWSAFRLTGHVDPGVLQQALDDLVRRQSGLRTIVTCDSQQVQPAASVELTIVHSVAVSQKDRAAAVARVVANALRRPRPADRAPLLTAFLVAFEFAESVLVLVIHRTVADGWTMQLAIRDTMAAYERRVRRQQPSNSVLRQQIERAHDDATALREEQIAANLPYWRTMLGDLSSLGIPVDRPRPPDAANGPKALYAFQLEGVTVAALRSTARSMGASFLALLLTAYAMALAERAGTTEVVVPVLHPGRDRHEWDTIGFFLDGHLHRLDFSGEPTLAECVARVHRSLADAQVHDVPLIRVMAHLPSVPALVYLAQSIPDVDDTETDRTSGGSGKPSPAKYERLRLPPAIVQEEPVIPADFLWTMEPDNAFVVNVTYNPWLFDESSIVAMAEHFQQILGRLAGLRAEVG